MTDLTVQPGARSARWTLALAGGYVGLAILGVMWGPVAISWHDWPAVLFGTDPALSAERAIVLEYRLPQMLLAGLVGAALACSGAALQSAMANPLADPGLLGVTAGGALGAVIALHTGLADRFWLALPGCALLGSMSAAALVNGLALAGGRPHPATVLLLGVAVGGLATAATGVAMLLLADGRVVQLLFWLAGGVRDRTWEHVALAGPGVLGGLAVLWGLRHRMDALLLGEEHALSVGVPASQTRWAILVACSLAVGCSAAAVGGVAFVGLMVPHLLRRITGPSAGALLPACVAGGAVFLTGCELLARLLTPVVPLGVGSVTAVLGGGFFLVLMTRQARAPS